MGKVDFYNNIMDTLPELFPPDLAAITLSNETHFVSIWGKPGNDLGNALKKYIYPGKKLGPEVMLGQVASQRKKIVKYFAPGKSICGLPYLAVGVPLYEDGTFVGGICAVREETILETLNRCKALLEADTLLRPSMDNVISKLAQLIASYDATRTIANSLQDITQKSSLLGLNLLLSSYDTKYADCSPYDVAREIQIVTKDCSNLNEKVVSLLNNFDANATDLTLSIRHIETAVSQTSNSIQKILDYLTEQSNLYAHTSLDSNIGVKE